MIIKGLGSMTEKDLKNKDHAHSYWILEKVREAFKKKNYETYGIFHMLVDPPPSPPTYGKSSVIFLLSKNDFWLILRLFNFFPLKVQKYLENFHDSVQRVGVEWGGGS